MHIDKPAAGSKLFVALAFSAIAMGLSSSFATAASHLHLEKDAQGMIRPFKAVQAPLAELVHEYSRVTGTPVTTREREVKGVFTVFLRHPLKAQDFTELFYRALNDNDYSVLDAPAGNGWVIERIRDARDGAVPVYEASEVPDSARSVTAVHTLKYADSEEVARQMRSLMPANSRIIPATPTQIFITDSGSNIRKLVAVLALLDVPKAKKDPLSSYPVGPPKVCGEQRIEKLVVEKLEIQDSGNNGLQQAVSKMPMGGVKK